MRMKKNIIVMVAALLLVLWIPKQVSAAGIVNGSCGGNSRYSYDTGTKVLTVSGTGEISDNPWKTYKNDIKKVIVNEGITSIEASVFENHTALTSVQLPESLTSIGFYAFVGCTGIKSITIPKNVTESGGYCFKNSGITTVTFEEGMIAVPKALFEECQALTTIHFPQTMKKIGESAFQGCKGLAAVTLPKSLTSIGFYAFADCTGIKSITIPKNVTESGGYCFKNSGITTVTFEEGMMAVPKALFEECQALTAIHFPQTMKKIGESAFEGCTGLTAVTLPKSLTSIGFYAFADCTGIKSITIPKNVTESGGYCFKNSGITTVTFEDGMMVVPKALFEECQALTAIHFPQTMKKIGESAFEGCKGLTTVTLPWYLEEIDFYSFAGCSNLKKITIYQNVKTIDDYAFKNVTGLTICGKKGTKAQTFAKGMKYSFAACKVPALKGITYKKGNLKYTVITDYINGKGTVCVTGMSKKASSVTIPNTVKLESYNYKVTQINKKAFYKKSALKKVTIKATGITKIGSNAFGKISKSATVYVPKSKYKSYSKMLKKAGVKSPMKIKKK